jgi:hypothetical protein
MELGNNKSKGYEGKDVQKPTLSESEKNKEMREKQFKQLAKLGPVIGSTVNFANSFSAEKAKQGPTRLSDDLSYHIDGDFSGVINLGDNSLNVPKFNQNSDYSPNDYVEEDGAFTSPPLGQNRNRDLSNRDINIGSASVNGKTLNNINISNGVVKADGKIVSNEELEAVGLKVGENKEYVQTNYTEAELNSKNQNEEDSNFSAVFDQRNQKVNNRIDKNGNLINGNFILGNVKGDVIYNEIKRESKPEYIPEQIEDPWLSNSSELPISPKEKALDELPELNYEVIKDGPEQFNSMEDVFAQMLKNWENQYGVEPIPKLESDSSNMEEIIDVINRNWETKYANLLDKKANQEPPQKEAKEVLRKRDKIKNVLKAVGTKIKDNLDKWSQKLDNFIYEDEPEVINNPSYYVETDTRSPEEKLSDSIKTINDNQRSNRYIDNSESNFGKSSPEMLQRRQKINEIKNQRVENQKTESPKLDREAYTTQQSQIDYVNQQDSITIPDNKSQKPEIKDEPLPFELIDNNSDQMDIKDQEKFIKDRMDSIDKLMTVEELENEIANIENGTISIPDLVAQESDYEDVEGTEHGVDKNGNISPLKLIKINEYQDARDINMLKTAEVLTALRQKKELLSTGIDLENLSGPSKAIYESRTFTLFNMSGKLVGMIGKLDDISTGRTAEQLPATVDDKGRLVVTEPNGKQYVVTDIKSKIIAQKTEEIKKQLNSRIENL